MTVVISLLSLTIKMIPSLLLIKLFVVISVRFPVVNKCMVKSVDDNIVVNKCMVKSVDDNIVVSIFC